MVASATATSSSFFESILQKYF